MGWLEDMNAALDYIEDNLKGKVDYGRIAQAACSSVYHFQRMFSVMADVSLSEYIRRRKMTMAAFELQNTKIRVIDLALDYGYESPEAFTRAFQNIHGVTPTEARRSGASLRAFPRISFQLTVKGVSEMKYKIVEKEAFQVYGIEEIFDTKDGENLRAIPDFWTRMLQTGEYEKLRRSAGIPTVVNALCGYREMEGTAFPYMLCTIKTSLSDTTGYRVVDIPGAVWAVFANDPHEMAETSRAVQTLTSRVYTEWLPCAQYEILPGFEFEMYYSDMQGRCYEEAWYRVTPKASPKNP